MVATPIGHLEDITLRALRILGSVGLVAAEDTRHSAKLLTHYDIRTPTTSLHEHNEHQKVPSLVARLLSGTSIAFVSDAGTPSVSDPGYRLVTAAIAAGVRVEAIPGASAVLTALVASGLPMEAFVFTGFAPPKRVARQAWFASLLPERRTIVFFEAPHRIVAALGDAARVLGDRRVAVGRELTKMHETWVRGPISDVLARLGEPRGEFTVVLEGAAADISMPSSQVTDQQILSEFCRMTEGGAGRRESLAAVAKLHKMRARDVFAAVDRARNS